MILKLYRVLGYEGTEPVLGSVIASFKGNKKSATTKAKLWLKENPQPIQPAWKWD